MKVPQGFLFAGVHAGLKPSRKDVALVVSTVPASAAACLTSNKAQAAPVQDLRPRVPFAGARAVVINSGNANALTGPQGLVHVREVREGTAQALGISPEEVLCASTGVIGLPLAVEKVLAVLPQLASSLGEGPDDAAEAMMTTDTRVKMTSRQLSLGGKDVTLSVLCKGSGMVAPQLATVLAVVVTDAALSPALLHAALQRACNVSFNTLTIDNDMSTNDSVLALANGLSGSPPLLEGSPELERFSAALTDVCQEMAREVAEDGEGATKLIEVQVTQAPSVPVAQDVARAIAGSSLVKAAVFGADPNWGRVLATVGARAGSQGFPLAPDQAKVTIQGLTVYDRGPVHHDSSALRSKMRWPEVRIDVALGQGEHAAHAWGCDLSYDYVKINADYTSLIVQTATGGVAKDDRLSNYSPSFKVSLLVEALSYIQRFSGKRCVVKCGGAVLVKESLKRAFCEDMLLLRSVGLSPIVVHGGGPEISRALERYGRKGEFVEGVYVGDQTDMKLAEMVMTGAVNQEFVTLLNREAGHAVGLSGKDGALIRAKKRASENGRDAGALGDITHINASFLELLLQQKYLPVISPVAIGADGQSYHVHADAVAAEVAAALGASKLIYVTNVPGILEGDERVSELTDQTLRERLAGESIFGGMRLKAQSILRALEGGVERVHVVDGRTPHSVIAELFTDHGVGTLITRSQG